MSKVAQKRNRSDSTSAAVAAMLSAAKPPIEVPKHVELVPEAMPYWTGVIHARARDEWTELDLVVGAQLAQCQYDMDRESRELREEGSVLINARGTQIMNPRHSVVEALARREMALMRTLRMGGRMIEDPRAKRGVRQIEAQSRKLHEQLKDDAELLAT